MFLSRSQAGPPPPSGPRSTSAPPAARCARRSPASSATSPPRSIAAYPRLPAGTARVSHAGPRLLGLGELERTRDDLADRIAEVRAQAAAQGERQAEARLLIERMLLDPGAYQLGAGQQRRHRRARLQELARRPAARHRRHAGRLVARQDLLRLPVSHLTSSAALMGRRSRARRAAQPAARGADPPAPARPAPPDRRAAAGAVAPVPARRAVRPRRARADRGRRVTGLDSDRGRLALLCGLVLASLGGLDTALREHFTGFRSHSSVLAGLPAVLVAGALFFGRAPWAAVAAGAVITFACRVLGVPHRVPPPVGRPVVPLK